MPFVSGSILAMGNLSLTGLCALSLKRALTCPVTEDSVDFQSLGITVLELHT